MKKLFKKVCRDFYMSDRHSCVRCVECHKLNGIPYEVDKDGYVKQKGE